MQGRCWGSGGPWVRGLGRSVPSREAGPRGSYAAVRLDGSDLRLGGQVAQAADAVSDAALVQGAQPRQLLRLHRDNELG